MRRKSKIEESVFLKTCPDQSERIITGIMQRKNGYMYELSCGLVSSMHFDFEISRERRIGNNKVGFAKSE